MHTAGNDSSPSRLVARTETSTVVAMEILVKVEVIAPVWVLLKFPRSPIDRTPSFVVAKKDAGQTPVNFFGDLIKVHAVSRAGGTFNSEIISIVSVVLD